MLAEELVTEVGTVGCRQHLETEAIAGKGFAVASEGGFVLGSARDVVVNGLG